MHCLFVDLVVLGGYDTEQVGDMVYKMIIY